MAKNKNLEVKKKARRVVDLGRLPKGMVTVEDVIEANDINDILAEVQSLRASIDGLLVAWRNINSTISYRYVKATDVTIVAICEIVKQHCIQRSWLSED